MSLKQLCGKSVAFALLFSLVFTPLLQVSAEEFSVQADVDPLVVEPSQPVSNDPVKIDVLTTSVISPDDPVSEQPVREDIEKPKEEKDPEVPEGIEESPNADRQEIKKQAKVDESTGALRFELAIQVPPGRSGLDPKLALVYTSQSKKTGNIFGVGWDTNIPYIERINKRGTGSLYTEQFFSSSLSGELATTSVSGVYYAESDGGENFKYIFSNEQWIVMNKNGQTYTFGHTSNARQDDPDNDDRINKWMLQEIRDTNDNYISYEYYKDEGQIYPSKIMYTGHGTTDGLFEIEFLREMRDDVVSVFSPDFEVKTSYRINEIQVKVNDSWVRKYELTYTTGDNNNSSLISEITESGKDESENVVTLPANHFEYQMAQPSFTDSEAMESPVLFSKGSLDFAIKIADVNGDGLQDLVRSFDGPDFASTTVYIHHGSDGWSPDYSWNVPETFSKNGDELGVRLLDINGDGFADIVKAYDSGEAVYNHRRVYLNNASTSGWTYDPSWVVPELIVKGYSSENLGVEFVDVNGDNLPDLVKALDGSPDPEFNSRRIYLNTGHSWVLDESWVFPFDFVRSGVDPSIKLADINGDNLVDILKSYQGSKFTGNQVYINNGHGWDITSTTIPLLFKRDNLDLGVVTADMNGDGLTDLVKSFEGGSWGYSDNIVYINTGENSWVEDPSWTIPELFAYQGAQFGVRIFDVNGDNLPDVVKAHDGSAWSQAYNYTATRLNNSMPSDLLIKNKNPQRGEITILYKGSAEYEDQSDNQLNPEMPYVTQTVKEIGYDDGVNSIASTTYEYAGGDLFYASPIENRLAGFSKVTATDPAGNVVKSFFHQGNFSASSTGEFNDDKYKIGRTYRVERYDDDNNLFQKKISKWETTNREGKANFVSLTQDIDFTYDGDSDHKDKAESYTFDSTTGNVIEKISWGEASGNDDGTFSDTGSDKLTTTISYASSSTSQISLPSQETTLDQSSNKVRESKFYYDNLSSGLINAGNLTKQEQWKSGSSYIDVEKSYNSHGLVTQEKDPRDKVTTYSYDSFNLYPASTTNPVGHTTLFEYDYSLGKPKKVTNPNGHDFEIVYDGLDRILEENQPDVGEPDELLPKTTYEYIDDEFPTSVIKTDHFEYPLIVKTYTYLDGLGREIQERKRAEDSNAYSVKDTVYNETGQKEKESLPYFDTGTSNTSPTSNDDLWIHYGYDALGRIKTIQNVVGETTNQYDDWKLTVTDANGKVKDLYKDAYGNLTRVDEHNTSRTYSTYYEYTGLGNLKKITDAVGNIRNFTYDGLGRRLSAQDLHAPTDNLFGIWNFQYDASGNLASTTDAKGQMIQYTYDDINRILTENFTSQPGTEVEYGYDSCVFGKGKLCTATSSAAVTSYMYDALGNINTETKKIDSDTFITTTSYDRQGNPYHILYPDNSEVQYTFNSGGQVETITKKEPGEGSFTDVVQDFDYSPEGKLAFQQNANETVTTNTYDPEQLYRLTNKTTQATSTTLQDISYTYDDVGNITKIEDTSDTDAARTILYTYDDLHRLITASSTAASSSGFKETYTYDAIGNIITKSKIEGTYTYTAPNIKSYANPHAVTGIGSLTFIYDANGNLGSTNFGVSSSYDYNNRMKSHTIGASTTLYAYDHAGDRVTQTSSTTGMTTYYPNKYEDVLGSKTTKYLWNGDNLVATVEKDGIYAPATLYSHTDHLSGASVVTNASGTPIQVVDYYPYGKKRVETGYDVSEREFTGHYFDEETDLSYMEARYYDGNIARFRQQDPVFLATGNDALIKEKTGLELQQYLADPQLLNSYSYVRNNPLKYKDQNGEFLLDMISLGLSLNDYHNNPTKLNVAFVGLDAVGLAVPVLPSLGIIRHGDDVARVIKYAPEAQKVAKGLNWGNPMSLLDHSIRHGNDFGLDPWDFKGYGRAANDFISQADTAIKQGSKEFDSFIGVRDGKTYFFNNKTNTFGIRNVDGTTATAYKPYGGDSKKAVKYWSRKKAKGGN